jgi:PPOX class probable F420-dependent enzyme
MNHPSTITPSLADLAETRYVALTTRRADGTTASTPVWPVDLGGGRIGFVTSTLTWKITRITRDPRVLLQPCDMKGRPLDGTRAVDATAAVATGDAFEHALQAVKTKYGFQLRIVELLHALPGRRFGHRNDCAVILTLDPCDGQPAGSSDSRVGP